MKRLLMCCAASLSLTLQADPMDYAKSEMPEFLTGACVHLLWNKGIPDSTLNMIRQGGFNAVRDEISWGRSEPVKGQLKFSPEYLSLIEKERKMGIQPLTILDYSNRFYDGGNYPRSAEALEGYARYCELVVNSLKGKNKLYQVWNEWDGGCGMEPKYRGTGDPASYMKLLKTVYPRIKNIDPQAIVISNSVCTGDDWLESTLKIGLLETCDVVALHTYNYSKGEGMNTPEKWHERMVKIDQMLRRYNQGKPFPLYVTEMGYPNQVDNRGSTYETTAMNIARTYLLARTLPYIKGMWWYDFQDDGVDFRYNEDNFGIIRPDQTPKSAYYVLRDIAPIINTAQFIRRISAADPDLWILQFRQKNGKDVLSMWNSSGDDELQVLLKNKNKSLSPVAVRHAGRLPYSLEWGSREWQEKGGGKISADALRFSLTGMPLLIEGDLSNIELAGVEKRAFPEKSRPQNSKLRLPRFTAPIVQAGKTEKYADFGLEENYHALNNEKWQGRSDLSARFAFRYDREKLYLTVEVEDNTFTQNDKIEDAWKGDGLQLAFQRPDDNGSASARTELDAALTPEGPRLLRRCAQDGSGTKMLDNAVKITRNGKITRYELAMNYQDIALKPLEPGAALAFSLLVNDNDGNGRKGFMHWGSGIGISKDPSQYYLLFTEF